MRSVNSVKLHEVIQWLYLFWEHDVNISRQIDYVSIRIVPDINSRSHCTSYIVQVLHNFSVDNMVGVWRHNYYITKQKSRWICITVYIQASIHHLFIVVNIQYHRGLFCENTFIPLRWRVSFSKTPLKSQFVNYFRNCTHQHIIGSYGKQ